MHGNTHDCFSRKKSNGLALVVNHYPKGLKYLGFEANLMNLIPYLFDWMPNQLIAALISSTVLRCPFPAVA